jgi:methylated-DNA-[protein]-cysteine S-methyltransferase
MGLKGRVMEFLRAGDERALGELVASEPRATRHLLGRLWDPDAELRRSSARALGVAAACRPDEGLELVRRLMWALNDESATHGVHAIPAIAEIGARAPDLVEAFVAPLASLAWDDGLRPAILEGLARIAETAPELVRPVCSIVAGHVDVDDPRQRAALAGLVDRCGGFDEA